MKDTWHSSKFVARDMHIFHNATDITNLYELDLDSILGFPTSSKQNTPKKEEHVACTIVQCRKPRKQWVQQKVSGKYKRKGLRVVLRQEKNSVKSKLMLKG